VVCAFAGSAGELQDFGITACFDAPKLRNLFLCTLLSAALTWLLVRFRGRRLEVCGAAGPVAAMFALVYVHGE